jgi:hypothetical protein
VEPSSPDASSEETLPPLDPVLIPPLDPPELEVVVP